jgi:hypothetical protein
MFSPEAKRVRPGAVLLAALLLATPGIARAQQAPGARPAGQSGQLSAGEAEALRAERARLRDQLEKINGEIDALKRAGGVGDDYRLRARLADAEAIARRLVTLDARLGVRASAPSEAKPVAAKPLVAPTVAPTDGPSDLEAKADILADQSRRLRAQADAYDQRVQQMKGRQELRRRAAELDRDPFAPLEASKRRVASNGATPFAGASPQHTVIDGPARMPPPSTPSNGSGQGVTSTATGPRDSTTLPSGFNAPRPESAAGGSSTGSLSVQLRDLLDTNTLADIRRLESGHTPAASAQALERASGALRARAAELEARARTMRAQAHPQH